MGLTFQNGGPWAIYRMGLFSEKPGIQNVQSLTGNSVKLLKLTYFICTFRQLCYKNFTSPVRQPDNPAVINPSVLFTPTQNGGEMALKAHFSFDIIFR